MSTDKMNEPTDFWKAIETDINCSVPTYLKNILRLRGFDNHLSITTLTDKDIMSLETFARTKMEKYIPSDANRSNYYHMFAEDRESFEILPGHIRLLKEIVKRIGGTTMTQNLSIFDPSKKMQGTNDPCSFRAYISHGTPGLFYIQLERDASQLDDMLVSLQDASTWPILKEIIDGKLCAAFFEGDYYRARIASLSDDGLFIHMKPGGLTSI